MENLSWIFRILVMQLFCTPLQVTKWKELYSSFFYCIYIVAAVGGGEKQLLITWTFPASTWTVSIELLSFHLIQTLLFSLKNPNLA